MAGPGNILIKVGADAGQAIGELSKVDKSLGSTMSAHEKMSAGISKAAVPAAAALVAIGAASIHAAKAAAEDQAAAEKLAGVLERTTGATKDQVAANEDWISSLSRATGVADDELRPALGKLAMATGSVSTAQDDLKIAMDVAAATGKDVVTVSAAIAKGYTGQTAGLNKLVPGLDQATLKSKDMSKIMGELADKTGGAAAAAAGTASGQFQIFTNQMHELEESLGAALLPVIQSLLPVLSKFADFAAENTTAIKILVAVVAGLAATILIANAAMKVYAAGQAIVKAATAAWTAAQWLLNAALDANPIGLVIIAVAALAAGLVIAYTKSATFRQIVSDAFAAVHVAINAVVGAMNALLNAASAAFNWITSHWKVGLFAFGPIGVAILAIVDNFHTLQSVASSVFNAIQGAIGDVTGAIHSVIGAVEALISALSRIHVPSIHIPNPFSLPASGSPSGRSAPSSSSASSGVTVNVYGAIDPEGTARAINRVLRTHERRLGIAL
jgi:phage-related minor tail protein